MIKEYQLSEPIPLLEFTDMLLDLADLIEAKVHVECLNKRIGFQWDPISDDWILMAARKCRLPPELVKAEIERAMKGYWDEFDD